MEGEVGRFRRRHLVPVPRVESLAELNALLEAADRADDARHIAGRLATVGGGRATCAAAPPRRTLRPHGRAAGEGRPPVPAACAGRTVDVRLGGGTVTALLGGRVLARHERSAHKGSEILVLDHYLDSGGGFTAAHEVEVLLLHRHLPAASVHAALDAVERIGSVDPALVAIEARPDGRRERPAAWPATTRCSAPPHRAPAGRRAALSP